MISIENLHFSYPKKEIFDGLNLQIKQGYIYGLLGKTEQENRHCCLI